MFFVVAAMLKNIDVAGKGAASVPAAHGGTLRFVSLEGLGLDAVLDRHAGGG